MIQTQKEPNVKARKFQNSCPCFDAIKDLRSDAREATNDLIDLTADIAAKYGDSDDNIRAANAALREARRNLDNAWSKFRKCDCMGDATEEVLEGQLDDATNRLNRAVQRFNRLTASP